MADRFLDYRSIIIDIIKDHSLFVCISSNHHQYQHGSGVNMRSPILELGYVMQDI
jgi:hypothetical protein